ncbi:glycine zipper domain-containing protein [Luteolibacter luteus]|uniref:Glycine zipper domain-containing protein n=1 Tax=Luteolibacter luteus TaxID=2728835 RepID=A0A858REG7_9BACT|nr:glycine zipper domain-containing protein [Luteolibacter luteus]QJE95217.1 hypothetical protein HHL09_05320 [Luteolibacter luteus]
MKSKDEATREARNEDPITGEPGSHPVGVGAGTTAGAAAGGAIGSVAGPVGAAVGAVVGGIAGAAAGKGIAERMDPTVEDAYWRENHPRAVYAEKDYTYDDDYRPAYQLGYEGPSRYRRTWDESEDSVKSEWENVKGKSRLTWDKARHATKAAWHRVEAKLPGDADKDGI